MFNPSPFRYYCGPACFMQQDFIYLVLHFTTALSFYRIYKIYNLNKEVYKFVHF